MFKSQQVLLKEHLEKMHVRSRLRTMLPFQILREDVWRRCYTFFNSLQTFGQLLSHGKWKKIKKCMRYLKKAKTYISLFFLLKNSFVHCCIYNIPCDIMTCKHCPEMSWPKRFFSVIDRIGWKLLPRVFKELF